MRDLDKIRDGRPGKPDNPANLNEKRGAQRRRTLEELNRAGEGWALLKKGPRSRALTPRGTPLHFFSGFCFWCRAGICAEKRAVRLMVFFSSRERVTF